MGNTIVRCAATLGAIFGTAIVAFFLLIFLFREDEDAATRVTPEQRIEALFSQSAIPPGRPPRLDRDPAELADEPPAPAQPQM